MTIARNSTTTKTELEKAIERYANSIEEIESAAPKLSEVHAIDVLLARDTVEELLSDKKAIPSTAILTLIELDERLKKQGKAIARSVKLAKLRQPLKPDRSAWWWFFQSASQIDPWDRFDWIWNVLSAAALGLGGSYMFITLQAFAVGGLGVAEAFGTIAQATGLALLGKGALTAGGHQQIQKWLDKVGFPSKFHSEVTCLGSILLMLSIYSIHTNLPNMLYNKALEEYNAGHLGNAEEKLLQAIQLNPKNSDFYIPLGAIYESTGEFDKALTQYKNAVADGDPKGFNTVGRIYIQRPNPLKKRPDPDLAETFLRAGLQRVENDPGTEYQLRRNLGWSLLAQKKYAQAEAELQTAIDLDSSIDEDQIGGGMAFCFLAESLTEQGKMQQAEDNWLECLDRARPETVSEYRWFIQIGQRKLAACLDTTGISAGPDKLDERLAESCERHKVIESIKSAALAHNKVPEIQDPEQIKALAAKVQHNLNQFWDAGLPESNATYQVSVNKEGSILSYKAVDKVAEQFQDNTGLDDLLQPNADGPVSGLKVVYTPDAQLNVTPQE